MRASVCCALLLFLSITVVDSLAPFRRKYLIWYSSTSIGFECGKKRNSHYATAGEKSVDGTAANTHRQKKNCRQSLRTWQLTAKQPKYGVIVGTTKSFKLSVIVVFRQPFSIRCYSSSVLFVQVLLFAARRRVLYIFCCYCGCCCCSRYCVYAICSVSLTETHGLSNSRSQNEAKTQQNARCCSYSAHKQQQTSRD